MNVVVVEDLDSSTYADEVVGVYSDMRLALAAVHKAISEAMPVVPANISYRVTEKVMDSADLTPRREKPTNRVYIKCELQFNNPPVTGFKRLLLVSYSLEYEDAVKGVFDAKTPLPVILKPRPDWAKDDSSN